MSSAKAPPPPRWTAAFVVLAGTPLALALTFAAGFILALLVSKTVRDSLIAEQMNASAIVGVIYLGLIFAAALVVRGSRLRHVALVAMIASILCCLAAIALWNVMIWNHRRLSGTEEEIVVFSAVSLTLFAIALLHNVVFTCVFIRSRALRIAVVIMAAAAWCVVLPLVGGIARAIAFEDEWPIILMGPFLGLLAVLVLFASAAMPALIRQSNARWEAARETVSERTQIAMECPKCGESQRLRAGSRSCRACGLLMNIEIEEPRCECGYLLYQLQSPACPECGRDVPAITGDQ